MGFLFAIAMMMNVKAVYAGSDTELVVVGAHVSSDTIDSTDRLTDVIRKLDGFVVVGPEDVQERLRGRGPRLVDEALQARGRSMLAEGKVLFEHADLEAAEERISAAIIMLENAMAGSSDARHLIDALLVRGNIGIAMGKIDSARTSYRRVVELDPDRELDSVHHPPKVVSLYTDVRNAVRAEIPGILHVNTADSNAVVVLNGRVRGRGNLVLRDVVPGDHHVLVTASNGHRDYEKVTVQSQQRSDMVANLEGYFIGQTPQGEVDKASQVSLIYRSLADQVTEGWVLMAGTRGLEEVGVQLYEPRTGNFSRVLSGEVGADAYESIASLTAQIGNFRSPEGMLTSEAVSSELLSLDIGTNPTLARVLFDSGDAVDTIPPQSSKGVGPVPWPVWAGIGTAVVGGVLAALLVGSSKSDSKTKEVTNETGTVVVRF